MENIIKSQRIYAKQMDVSLEQRIMNLKTLKNMLVENEEKIYEALYNDLQKSESESFVTEVSLVYAEIDAHIKHLAQWMKTSNVKGSKFTFNYNITTSFIPKQTSLIIAPWNYPIHLLFMPLVGSISAGNVAILKPSEIAKHTAYLVEKLVDKYFDPRYLKVINGGAEVSQELLRYHFGQIFFTGSTRVGKLVSEAASKTLSPVILELGGKSPAIIDETANIKQSVKQIVWGKNINKGQTCISPDFIMCQMDVYEDVKNACLKEVKKLKKQDNKIITAAHEERIRSYYEGKPILNSVEDQIIVMNPNWDEPVMKEEIFGNVLPIIIYKDRDHLYQLLERYENSLSLYLFTKQEEEYDYLLNRFLFGGGCINGVFTHLLNHNAPFGGVNSSGIGKYHGKYSFELFSHHRTLATQKYFSPLPLNIITNKISYAAFKKIFVKGE